VQGNSACSTQFLPTCLEAGDVTTAAVLQFMANGRSILRFLAVKAWRF
jgi:hypothetical protein